MTPGARWSVKHHTFWNGYRVHVTKPCGSDAAADDNTVASGDSRSEGHGDDGEAPSLPHLIVNVETTDATVPDNRQFPDGTADPRGATGRRCSGAWPRRLRTIARRRNRHSSYGSSSSCSPLLIALLLSALHPPTALFGFLILLTFLVTMIHSRADRCIIE